MARQLSDLTYRLGVEVFLLNDKNEILILKKMSYGEGWGFPGGGREGEDTVEENAYREVKEELGVDDIEIIKIANTVNQFDWSQKAIDYNLENNIPYRGQRKDIVIARLNGNPEFKLQPEEIKEVKWVSIEDLPEHMIFPGQREWVEKVIAELVSS